MLYSLGTKELLLEIDQLKQSINVVVKKKGLIHPDTIKLSQELDRLIFKFQINSC
jgi:hypothetical protein